tara:strand:- start:697 stop:870 length:174 start_codon:yes stop_codon:yes gene_type:complete
MPHCYEKYQPETEVEAEAEPVEKKFLIVPKMPFGLTVFQVVQVLMLSYIILKQNKLV